MANVQILAFTVLMILTCHAQLPKSDVGLSPVGIIQNHGYPAETHYVTTEDGYILTYFRIPSPKAAFILEHGMLSSSVQFVCTGNMSLAFFLADAGYDVWIGNARGTTFSRNHTILDPDRHNKQFYNFSWHEIGYYDLPASIDYILKLKNEQSLYYVGHSQGTTVFFVMASTRPEYNKKIKVAHLFTPAAILAHIPNQWLVGASKGIDLYKQLLELAHLYEIPFTQEIRKTLYWICLNPNLRLACELIFTVSQNSKKFDSNVLPVCLGNFPSNTALKQALHYAQMVNSGKFQKFDYGPSKNMKLYGNVTPPLYSIRKIKAPTALYYAASDNFLSVKDIRALRDQLPNVVLDYLVPRQTFNHVDFMLATDVVSLVYNKLLEITQKFP